MSSLTVQIPQPCHERWDDMQLTERGRFCTSCQKIVVDYTALSDQELVRLLSKPLETTCGRFRNEQLNRTLLASNQGANSVWRHWVSLLTMSLFGWQTARAQLNQTDSSSRTASTQQPSERFVDPIKPISGKTALGGSVTTVTVTGKVMLMDSSGSLSPIPKATVFVNVSYPGQGGQTQADNTGTFTLSISMPMEVTKLSALAYAPDHNHEKITFEAAPSTTPIVLDNIILYTSKPVKEITGGGISIIKISRWQKLKRKLFH